MDGWMDGCMNNSWPDELMEGWIYGLRNRFPMDGLFNRLLNASGQLTDGWIDLLLDRLIQLIFFMYV